MTTSTEPQDGPWDQPYVLPARLSDEEVARWQAQRLRLAETAKRFGWSKAEVARRSGVPHGTLTPWFDGSYKGSFAGVGERFDKWLAALEETSAIASRIRVAPDFITTTPTARKIIDALIYAQTSPEMVLVTMAPGMGKTAAGEHFAGSRPHVYRVTMRPHMSSVYLMLQELAAALEVDERNPARIDRAIGDRLKRNGRHTLLIIDEAQNLAVRAVNQLRYFLDDYGCGIALLGNEELYGRLTPKSGKIEVSIAQLHSRMGLRLKEMTPDPADIAALLDAWEIADEDMRRLGAAIGRKPGALRTLNKTLQLAGMYAAGARRPMTIDDMRQAMQSRGLEG